MYENLKDEIRSVVRPNFKSQINGQNLQDVLIDMVDNYPTGSEDIPPILAKTGSWDNAATWVTDNSASLVTSESLYPVVEGLEEEIQEVKDTYATTASLENVSSSLNDKIEGVSSSLGDSIQDVKDTYATTASLNELSESIASTFPQYATTESLNQVSSSLNEKIDGAISGSGFATTESLNNLSSSIAQDFSKYATTASVNAATESVKQWVEDKHYLTEHQDISGLATTTSVNSLSESVANDFANLDIPDISGLATTSSVNSLSESVGTISASFDQRINAITGSGGGSGSALWLRSGLGGLSPDFEDNVVRPAVSGALNLGRLCNAGAYESIAEGYETSTSASYSHTFGRLTSTTNNYEVAMGLYNDNQPGQLFSVGVGETIGECCKGNAISVINHGTASAYFEPSASVYILGVGSYKGYNPAPGVNDVATIITRLLNGETDGLWHPDTGRMAVRQITASVASGDYATAEGWHTTSSGESSHAEGSSAVASDWAAHAEGLDTLASNRYAHAEGGHTRATAYGAHAEGLYTTASGQSSHAEGTYSEASGDSSHAEGNKTVASNNNEHACGRFNATASNQIFSVGVGHGWQSAENPEVRRNAVSIITPGYGSNDSASVYVQGINGYNGTNPISGSNDLATLLGDLSRETWTFILEDSSSVTKSVLVH